MSSAVPLTPMPDADARFADARFADIVVDAALDCIVGMDGQGLVVAFNPAAERTFGYSRAEAIGRPVAELIVPPELRARHQQAVQRHAATGIGAILGTRTTMPAQRADGGRLTVELIVVDAGPGAPARYVAYLRDLTLQRRAEAELRASEARLRSIVDDQTELICRADPSFRLTFCNAAHARLWGCSPAELVGRDFFTTIPPRLHAPLRAALEALTPANPLLYGENEKVFSDGSVRWFEWLNRALFDAEDRLTGYQSVGRDVTERRAAAEELNRHREALVRSERLAAFGSLLAGVAHELNNPLAVVLTQAVLMQEQAADTETRHRAERILAAAERCARTVRSFLAIARAKPPVRGRVSLPDVARAMLELTAYALRSSGVTIETAFAPGLPQVWGDADQMGQVVLNLVINAEQAVRFRPGIRLIRIGGVAEQGTVRLDVSDNGPGIPAADRDRVFDPFYTTKPDGIGTGLGLSICRRIVEAHGGRIEIGDSPEGGARILVTLPDAASVDEAPLSAEPPPAAQGGAVLVVDDDPDQAQGLAETLAAVAGRVDIAVGGLEALRLARANRYALVVSDVRMPDLDGPGLLRALRRDGFAGRMILVTGDTLDRSLEASLAGSAVLLLEKPLMPREIRKAVAEALAQAEGSKT